MAFCLRQRPQYQCCTLHHRDWYPSMQQTPAAFIVTFSAAWVTSIWPPRSPTSALAPCGNRCLSSTPCYRRNWCGCQGYSTSIWYSCSICTGSRQGVWSNSDTPICVPASATQRTDMPSMPATTVSVYSSSAESGTACSSTRALTTSP